ncbi:MAG: TetR/AcrR family transcriptional regulator [Clostridia bacterium]|nr:TetR/AcrR family transcriptional regulator [Clostridia bacterium]
MAKDTKRRILDAALDMFSEKGYAGTNIRELSASLNLGKSSLYRHFESKEEIWNAVIDMMAAYYDEHFGSVDNLPVIPQNTDELYKMTMGMVDFTIHDERIVKVRKLLLTEQFHDERARRLATRYFLEDTEEIFTNIFEGMMKNGSIRKMNSKVLAFSYTSPITSLVHLCDREPEREPEAKEKLDEFLRMFIEEYGE